ncbi:glucose-6-phosphate dehydrogenase [Microbacterium sp. JZ37]|uniref:glucose-6-phosphate dehydrogenase n=1 Tax=Microbacterium sp. JZ37 TaxID=2654193 RepID=UPI002B46AB5F|nr:glucose-6-phosphate dehydrogenase [Microbacterium sp. JZ37]WRH17443.1 glucose-6-phosphate dehydrogenase [Microbacterium sp. JZ37]
MTKTSASILILGAGGDLTRRLLLPGLASLLTRREYDVQVIGAGLDDRSDVWDEIVRTSFEAADVGADPDALLDSTAYIPADATSAEDLKRLLDACAHTPVIYFALPPAVSAKVCEALREVELPEGTRLALEKPFGTDLESARRLNRLLTLLVPEEQIFRIDHFLGMSMVLNVLGLRFANRVLEGAWRAEHVERVEIVFDETLALEGRGGYYDSAGALVDMLQSHLLEVLSLVALEPLPRLDQAELRSNIAQVLRSTRVWDDDPVGASKRARYTAGRVGERDLPSYVDEEGVDPARETETLAQITCAVDTPRWRGVPFVLRSGKAISADRTTVTVRFKPAPEIPGFIGEPKSDSIVLDLLSGEVALDLSMNGSGDPFTLEQTRLSTDKAPGDLLPYGQVLEGILDGDPLLSVRGDIAEECWRIVAPVLEAWREGRVPLEDYAAGSAGPDGWGTAAG